MEPIIKYHKEISKEIKELIIVLSKFNELKNINNLPIDTKLLFQSKEIEKILQDNQFYESYIRSHSLGSLINVKIILVKDLKNHVSISQGAKLYSKFNKNSSSNLFFNFSNKLLKSNNILCSDLLFGLLLRSYCFDKYKNNNDTFKIKTINLINSKNYKLKNFQYSYNLLTSINFAKDLVSEPANVLNPVSFANLCKNLKIPGLKIKILDLNKIKKIGMNALLGVAQGSVNPPRVVIFEWNLKKNKKPTILVGKGVTFDTGGISLKPAGGMEEMITDMGGSATVVGSMMNAALNKINKPIVGIIGLVENMPDGKAQRPGDIVKSLSGQTIEVLNTDAEGRLVLGDALDVAVTQKGKDKPRLVIDAATLTGAIKVGLGSNIGGLFSNNDSLASALEKSSQGAGDPLWRMPLDQSLRAKMKSHVADMTNAVDGFGGAITAALFLESFIFLLRWLLHFYFFNIGMHRGFTNLHSAPVFSLCRRFVSHLQEIKDAFFGGERNHDLVFIR